MLGSAYVELELSEGSDVQRVVFSGDLGAPHSPLLPDRSARARRSADSRKHLARRHEDRAHRRERLQAAIERALDQGTVLIPSFSIGRTQELLFELEEILHEKREAAEASGTPVEAPEQARDGDPDIDWPQLPIILDSPLASRFTATYKELQGYWDEDARHRWRKAASRCRSQLITVDSHDEHMRIVEHLAQTARPAIVIAGNGARADASSITRAMLGTRDTTWCSSATGKARRDGTYRDLQTYGDGGFVDLDAERIDIRAGIDSVGGYSATPTADRWASSLACSIGRARSA